MNKRKLEILHPILCYYPSQAGGPANTIYWLNSALNKKKFQLVIVTTYFGIKVNTYAIDYGSNQSVSFLNSKGMKFIKLSLKSLKGGEIIQFSSLFFPPTLPLLLVAIIKNKSIIMSPRGELYDSAISQKSFRKKLWLSIIKLLQNKIHFHATNSFEEQKIHEHFPKAKSLKVIPNFIVLPEKIIVDTKMQFVFLGRINPIKNIDILVRAFKQLLESISISNLELLIVGSTRLAYELDYKNELLDLINSEGLSSRIKFLGHLEGKEKEIVIAESKALILPSKSENFGNVILEALAQGTPVIASKNTPWQILEDTGSGYWVNPDIDSLKIAMHSIFCLKKKAYQKMCNNAYELCKTKFDIQSNIHIWENYYKIITDNV